MSKVGYKALVEAAEARIRTISAVEATDKLDADDVVFVDVRDVRELGREGGFEACKAARGEVALSRK